MKNKILFILLNLILNTSILSPSFFFEEPEALLREVVFSSDHGNEAEKENAIKLYISKQLNASGVIKITKKRQTYLNTITWDEQEIKDQKVVDFVNASKEYRQFELERTFSLLCGNSFVLALKKLEQEAGFTVEHVLKIFEEYDKDQDEVTQYMKYFYAYAALEQYDSDGALLRHLSKDTSTFTEACYSPLHIYVLMGLKHKSLEEIALILGLSLDAKDAHGNTAIALRDLYNAVDALMYVGCEYIVNDPFFQEVEKDLKIKS